MPKRILIKDTTREEREEIVRKGLSCDANECENCSACGMYGAGDMLEIYQPYIDGKEELAEINQRFREEWLGNAACAADKREERKEKREEIRNRLSAMDFMVLERSGGD